MKNILMFFSALLLFLVACKQNDRKVTADLINMPISANGDTGEPRPVIEFDSTEFHFGVLAVGESVSHVFKFKNTGNAPLIISQVKPSCGCTTLKDWPKDPIAPGDSGQITAEFNSKGNSGEVTKNILVSTNALPKDWNLKITGIVAGVKLNNTNSAPIEMQRVR